MTMRVYFKDGTTQEIEADRVGRVGDDIVFTTLGSAAGGVCARYPLSVVTGQVDLDASYPPAVSQTTDRREP